MKLFIVTTGVASVLLSGAGFSLLYFVGGWKLAMGVLLVDLGSFCYDKSTRNIK